MGGVPSEVLSLCQGVEHSNDVGAEGGCEAICRCALLPCYSKVWEHGVLLFAQCLKCQQALGSFVHAVGHVLLLGAPLVHDAGVGVDAIFPGLLAECFVVFLLKAAGIFLAALVNDEVVGVDGILGSEGDYGCRLVGVFIAPQPVVVFHYAADVTAPVVLYPDHDDEAAHVLAQPYGCLERLDGKRDVGLVIVAGYDDVVERRDPLLKLFVKRGTMAVGAVEGDASELLRQEALLADHVTPEGRALRVGCAAGLDEGTELVEESQGVEPHLVEPHNEGVEC